MSESTLTAPFGFTTFGAVKVEVVTNKTVSIPADRRADFDRARAFFASQPNTQKLSLDFPTPEDADELHAQLQSYADGRDDITASFPTWSAAHVNVKVTRDGKSETSSLTPSAGRALQAKLVGAVPAGTKDAVTVEKDKDGNDKKVTISAAGVVTVLNYIPDNKVPKHFNVCANGRNNVTWRFSKIADKAESKNGPVIVTQSAPAPAA